MTDTRRRLFVVIAVGIVAYLVLSGRLLTSENLLLLAVLVPSVILHEVSHGAVAYAFGDDTAKRAGRLTLNPIKHIDPFGTIILPTMLVLIGAPAFGFAKPVPVNLARLRRPRDHGLLVSLAGPATNVTLVVLATACWRVMDPHELTMSVRFISAMIEINLLLALFNMLPIPPLDGSALVERLLPRNWWPGWLKFRQYAMGLLLLLLLMAPAQYSFGRLFNPVLEFWGRTFLG